MPETNAIFCGSLFQIGETFSNILKDLKRAEPGFVELRRWGWDIRVYSVDNNLLLSVTLMSGNSYGYLLNPIFNNKAGIQMPIKTGEKIELCNPIHKEPISELGKTIHRIAECGLNMGKIFPHQVFTSHIYQDEEYCGIFYVDMRWALFPPQLERLKHPGNVF